jgi:Ca2+-binding EF-hand superfamily protein
MANTRSWEPQCKMVVCWFGPLWVCVCECVAHAFITLLLVDHRTEMERKIAQGSIDYRGWKYSADSKEFVQHTAMVNAGFRLTAAAALKHPWIEKTVASWKLPNELVISFDLFRVAPPLKRIALNCLAKKAPPNKYEKMFTDLDTTESGTLTKEEFMEGFKHSGNSKEELVDLFDKLDVNMNGEIMYTEFVAATLEAHGELEEAQLEEAFDMISKKGKYITKKNVMKIVGEEQKMVLKAVGAAGTAKKETKNMLKSTIDSIFTEKEKFGYEDFARMFEHGFDANRDMDAIIETSLNEEQLSALKEDDLAKHMATISESDD